MFSYVWQFVLAVVVVSLLRHAAGRYARKRPEYGKSAPLPGDGRAESD
jgi:hypothetical protein